MCRRITCAGKSHQIFKSALLLFFFVSAYFGKMPKKQKFSLELAESEEICVAFYCTHVTLIHRERVVHYTHLGVCVYVLFIFALVHRKNVAVSFSQCEQLKLYILIRLHAIECVCESASLHPKKKYRPLSSKCEWQKRAKWKTIVLSLSSSRQNKKKNNNKNQRNTHNVHNTLSLITYDTAICGTHCILACIAIGNH